MKILLVSDSHNDTESILSLANLYPNMDYYLHAGDSQDCSMNIYPFDSVRGNCDFYEFDYKIFIRTKYINILMKHYPSIDMDEKQDIKLFIHGHTHKAEIKEENGLIILCPGSISASRDKTGGSYALIEINENNINIRIYSLETKKLFLKRDFNIK